MQQPLFQGNSANCADNLSAGYVPRAAKPRNTERTALLGLADTAASAGLDTEEAHLLRAASLVDGSAAWAARPYLVKLFLGTAWDRRRRAHCRDARSVIELLNRKARLYLAGVQVVRRIRQLPAPELGVEELPVDGIGSGVARWAIDAPSSRWPALYHGASINVWLYPGGRYWAELQICFPDTWRTQFVLKGSYRAREAALQVARRWAALGAVLVNVSGDRDQRKGQ